MTFPILVAGVHPHHVFDALAFLVGGRLFWRSLRRERADPLTREQRWLLAGGCVLGAAFGAKLLVLLEDPVRSWENAGSIAYWLSGKSIVGGLLGGVAGVEIAKMEAGISRSTGDHFAVPVAVGLAIGRVGCFLSGLTDDAYGTPTTLPWGVDFGDGVPRHPTQLYEAGFALALATFLLWRGPRREERGDLFRLLMVSYLTFRFASEFLRPYPTPYLGLSAYQVASLAGLAYYLKDARTRLRLARLVRGGSPS